MENSGMDQNGKTVEWNRIENCIMDENGKQQNGIELKTVEWTNIEKNGMDQNGLDCYLVFPTKVLANDMTIRYINGIKDAINILRIIKPNSCQQ